MLKLLIQFCDYITMEVWIAILQSNNNYIYLYTYYKSFSIYHISLTVFYFFLLSEEKKLISHFQLLEKISRFMDFVEN